MASLAEQSAPNEEWQAAIARSVVYLFLSRALAYPASEHLAMLREQVLPVLEQIELDDDGTSALRAAAAGFDASLETLQSAHVAVFSLTVSADCPDFETAYLPNDVFRQAGVMADVSGFYKAHGLEVGGQLFQRPDYLTTELEFMGFLARKEAYAIEHLGAEQLEMVREAQSLFMRDHLGCWGGEAGRRIEAQGAQDKSVYEPLGKLLTSWMNEELDRLAITPDWTASQSFVEWPEPDDGTCGAEASCPVISLDEVRPE